MANYLYNGVELPELPNDIADYSYHMIYIPTGKNYYRLIVSQVMVQYTSSTDQFFINGATRTYNCYSDTWAFDDKNDAARYADGTLIWTNKNVYWTDGGDIFWYMTGSDPVPIESEPDTSEPDTSGAVYMDIGGVRTKCTAYMDIDGVRMLISSAETTGIPTGWLTFSSADPFTIGVNNATKNWDGTLYCSTDTTTWSEWDGTAAIASAEHDGEHRIYMSGSGNSVLTGSDNANKWVLTGSNIACTGNIEHLLDFETVANDKHPIMGEYCFYFMFRDCASLTTAPELPATTLTSNCYCSMFSNCTGLTVAPELPATTVAERCCYQMFYNCTSLKTAPPKFPATTLATYCYGYMFYGCTNLTTAPELPATTLATHCYDSMFRICKTLTTAPELPATTMFDYCYNQMFYDCASLTTAPELPATTLAIYCYKSMFYNCTALETAPELPATSLADYAYSYMFYGCTNLTTAPELPATTLAIYCYRSMFYNCTSLTTIPKLPATKLATYCYYYMFRGCTNIKLSTSKTGSYQTAYRIPTSGTGTNATMATYGMFYNTGGTFTVNSSGYADINKTYYTSNTVV